MKTQIPSNPKIKCTLLSILFSILFIFTALYFTDPLIANASGSSLYSSSNGKGINGTEVDSTATANYLFWAASEDRTGILFYIVDDTGALYGRTKLLIMDNPTIYNSVANKDKEGFTLLLKNAVGVETSSENIKVLRTPSGFSTKPVTYSNGWHATGNVNSLLTSDTKLSTGEEVPYWFKYATMLSSDSNKLRQELSESESHWTVVAEPVSIQYIYSNDRYTNSGIDTLGHQYQAGDPLPAGSDPSSTNATPYIFCGTARQLALAQVNANYFYNKKTNPASGGEFTYKFLNMALPWSMCLDHNQEVGDWIGGRTGATKEWIAPTGNGEQLSLDKIAVQNYATGVYFVDISAMLPPIHTKNPNNPPNTPGNTEPPDPGKGTDGDCTIKKLYYTEYINTTTNTSEIEYPKPSYFERTSTTNYICIENEPEYQVEGWKVSTNNCTTTTREAFYGIKSVTNQGKGSATIEIQQNSNQSDKYLYVLLKRTVIISDPPDDWDFRLEQSQITKRVSFLQGNGPATTKELYEHVFTWTSAAPSVTSCSVNNGLGHGPNCEKSEHTHSSECCSLTEHTHSNPDCYKVLDCVDTENHTKDSDHTDACYRLPRTTDSTWKCVHPNEEGHVCTIGSGCYQTTCGLTEHTHGSGCNTKNCKYGYEHTHNAGCYEKCSNFQWTDNTTKLGIKLDISSCNKAVVSVHNRVVYDNLQINWISNAYPNYGTDTATRTGTGESSKSYSGFNCIVVLFRGQDKLTLADWKNGGPVEYLTSIAQESSYNFKSANTPQGNRKVGDAYEESFNAKFVSDSPDISTTYKATVGKGGVCEADKSKYYFDSSSAYTISNIKVNIQVFWANGVSPSANTGAPSGSLTAGSINGFYPYIRMRYDTDLGTDLKVYVLGQQSRSATFYDFANVSLKDPGTKTIKISSNQWSTHAEAQSSIISKLPSTSSNTEKETAKSSILPGGATLSLSISNDNTHHIVVTTCQAYLAGAGLAQVNATGGTYTLPTDESTLTSHHDSLVSSVASKARQAYITEYITTGVVTNTSDTSKWTRVAPGISFNNNTLSKDSKYHFNGYDDSKFNVNVGNTQSDSYTFFTNTLGEIRCTKNNTSPDETAGTLVASKGSDKIECTGIIATIASKTNVVGILRGNLIDNEGDDTEAPWASDGKWYNEAFDGITYLYSTTTIDVGFWDPLERSTVLDPKETPSQGSKDSFFSNFNSAFFASYIDGGPTVTVGTFTNSNGQSKSFSLNFGNMYKSRVFYIPNVTTQDLK